MERFTEHRASSLNNDAGLWRMLLVKAKNGTTTEPYFAANIVEGSLQTTLFAKLGLPAEFLEHHRHKLTENIILEGPDGHKWPVMLGQSWDSKPCLLHGWLQFATDYNLGVNDQILFFLLQDSHFLVQVFDSNHNIKRRGVGTSAPIATTPLPKVMNPFPSFGFQTTTRVTRPNVWSLPTTSRDSGVAKNVHEENRTTQASPSGVKLGNREPGVADFNANSRKVVLEGFRSAQAPPDAAENQALGMERARNLIRETTVDRRGGGALHKSCFDPNPEGSSTLHTYLKEADTFFLEVSTLSRVRARTWKEPKEEKIPEKRARQAPTERSKAVSSSTPRTRQARGTKTTSPDDLASRATKSAPPPWNSPDDPASRATKSAPPPWNRLKVSTFGAPLAAKVVPKAAVTADTAKAREAAEASAVNKASETPVPVPVPAPAPDPVPIPASAPVTPRPLEAPKQVFKRPQPRDRSQLQQLFYSKRRPITPHEREAALEAGHRYAAASFNRTHVMQLRASQVYYGKVLDVTLDFAAAMELPLQGHRQVTLYDQTGRTWAAVWHGEHPKRIGLASSGWTSFVLDHYLEEGDVCVFELPNPKVSNICVKVFPIVPVTPTASGWRDHYSVDGPLVPPPVVQPEAEVGLDQATGG